MREMVSLISARTVAASILSLIHFRLALSTFQFYLSNCVFTIVETGRYLRIGGPKCLSESKKNEYVFYLPQIFIIWKEILLFCVFLPIAHFKQIASFLTFNFLTKLQQICSRMFLECLFRLNYRFFENKYEFQREIFKFVNNRIIKG